MSETMTGNGRQRKTLASQLDRLDGILDALSDGLNGAVQTAVEQAVGRVVGAAVQAALAEALADAELRRRLPPAPAAGGLLGKAGRACQAMGHAARGAWQAVAGWAR